MHKTSYGRMVQTLLGYLSVTVTRVLLTFCIFSAAPVPYEFLQLPEFSYSTTTMNIGLHPVMLGLGLGLGLPCQGLV